MSDIDYEELFRSPLDDADSTGGSGWAPFGGGLVVGVIAVLVSAMLWGGGDAEPAAVATAASSGQPSSPVAAAEPSPFPPGYNEYVPGLGIRPEEIVISDEVISVIFTTAVERGGDPLRQSWPLGGTWWLETADGSGVASTRVVLGRSSPGALTVQFPVGGFAGSPELSKVSMVERWDHPTVTGSASLPFAGEPYVMTEPLVVPISDEANLILDELELGRFLGKAAWRIEGDGNPRARAIFSTVLADADGNRVGAYSSFPEILEPAIGGTVEIFWSEPFPTSQEGAVTVAVEYEVGIVESVPAELVVDLSEVPVGR